MPATHVVSPGTRVHLQDWSCRGRDFCDDRDAAEAEFRELREQFVRTQPALYAESAQSLLIVLQAIDAGGKDSTIRKMLSGVNPQGVRVASFKKPSTLERSHDFLWRIHQRVPAQGMISVFNRSHYEDVLVVRVDQLVPEATWKARYEIINQFEHHLVQSGTRILKFFLHISKDEQKERFQDRIDKPHKHWKFDHNDLHKRAQWDDYQAAFEDMLTNCSTEDAPWYVIPANQKWYRDLAIMKVITDTLKDMNPEYPEAEDLSGTVIED